MPRPPANPPHAVPYSKAALAGDGHPRTFTGPNLLQIAMPLGGIGAGCVCLNGYGGLEDLSIANQPSVTALPDGHNTDKAAFALLHIKGANPITRLVEGQIPIEKVYDQGVQSQGYRKGGHEGLPRFENCTFTGEYPFGTVDISGPSVPIAVQLTGWSPFIPLDDVSSGIPAAILDYRLTNTSNAAVEFEFSYHVSHMARGVVGWEGTRCAAIPGAGVHFTNTDSKHAATYGSAALAVVGHRPKIKSMWFRGHWFDAISALWRQVSEGRFTENERTGDGDVAEEYAGTQNGGSVMVPGRIEPGQSVTIPVVLSWHFPNVDYAHGQAASACGPEGCAPGECEPAAALVGPRWKPFYATQWASAAAAAQHVIAHYGELRAKTQAFKDALFSTTAPDYVLDAVSANLGILKSPTVLRQANGNVWGWEGCFATEGCCAGSCTHVWNYAQAMPHLFPQLERTLREQEYVRSMDDRGHVTFRSALPDGPTDHGFHAASDGQLGGVMKLFRDWHICGDNAWMGSLYPLARRSLDYCIGVWDPDEHGALFEPHHNTYDIEFWGPDGMCTGIYLGALIAAAEMSEALGDTDTARRYREIAARGAAFIDEALFNGEYYEHRVMYKELRDQSFAKSIERADDGADEILGLLKAEGPKYQYGTGCLSDGVIGHWMSTIYGIATPQTRERVIDNLRAIFTYNFRADLFDHVCLQRPGYAIGHEPGLLLCTWPNGGKPTLPFPYSDECWTGFEYQAASHMIALGLVDEGLTIVRAARARYEGRGRNPWNEFECGSYYARAMSSYALLGALSGFRYSAVTRTLHFGPQTHARPYRTFFCTAGGYGTITLDAGALTVSMIEGALAVETLELTIGGETRIVECDLRALTGRDCVTAI